MTLLADNLQLCSTVLDFTDSSNAPRTTINELVKNKPIKTGYINGERKENLELSSSNRKVRTARARRSILQLANVLHCVTGCNPLTYKGYGCYCGYMGKGEPVDEIDRCCLEHDWCYAYSACPQLLVYFVSYQFQCVVPGYARCRDDSYSMASECAAQLCECDRNFAHCVSKYSCPLHRATCLSSSSTLTVTFHNLVQGRGF
ncbi:basic phospholipase A2 2-like [Limulus polyphemus]|uniref:Phospholipase A2 n=1 Tax=Limulus polyphemus TaxID=6850 RepID=A0ABM1SSY5_LIMPO|nr:basic phospholipase A2 2-like [Limulus polyphemus]